MTGTTTKENFKNSDFTRYSKELPVKKKPVQRIQIGPQKRRDYPVLARRKN